MTVVLPHDCLLLFCYLEDVGRVSQHPQVYNRSILSAGIDAFQDHIYLLSGSISITPCAIGTALIVSQLWS